MHAKPLVHYWPRTAYVLNWQNCIGINVRNWAYMANDEAVRRGKSKLKRKRCTLSNSKRVHLWQAIESFRGRGHAPCAPVRCTTLSQQVMQICEHRGRGTWQVLPAIHVYSTVSRWLQSCATDRRHTVGAAVRWLWLKVSSRPRRVEVHLPRGLVYQSRQRLPHQDVIITPTPTLPEVPIQSDTPVPCQDYSDVWYAVSGVTLGERPVHVWRALFWAVICRKLL